MSIQLPHNFQNKSVQQIVQELMYDEYLERENMLRNAFISSPLKSVKKKLVFSKNRYQNYLQQTPKQQNSPATNNQCKIIGIVMAQKKKKSAPSNLSLNNLIENTVSPINNTSNTVNTKKTKDHKPKELRGLSISDHMTRQKCLFPQIQRQSIEKQQIIIPESDFNDDNFEGYKLKSEEMSLEIDEYMKMKQHNDHNLLPKIYQRNQ